MLSATSRTATVEIRNATAAPCPAKCEYQRHRHDGSAGGCDEELPIEPKSRSAKVRRTSAHKRRLLETLARRGGRIYQPCRSIAKFHPLILASDLSELVPFAAVGSRQQREAATWQYQPTSQREIPEQGLRMPNILSILYPPPNWRRRYESWRMEKYLGDNVRIASINLIEPAKSLVENYKPGSSVRTEGAGRPSGPWQTRGV